MKNSVSHSTAILEIRLVDRLTEQRRFMANRQRDIKMETKNDDSFSFYVPTYKDEHARFTTPPICQMDELFFINKPTPIQ
jgi:hypothetical protein